jgi:peptidoglycan/LPS O-acetylase OafA/YrhL
MTDAAATQARGRAPGLESLRGWAAFAILLYHLEALYLPLPPGALKSAVATLGFAVPLFFALSAYSLLYGYSSRIFDRQSLLRFYVRRVFRIVPLFYLMLLLNLVARHFEGMPTPNSEIFVNLLFLFPFLPGKHESLVPAGWSLGIEWLFYIAFPVFALLARSVTASCVAFLACALLSVSIGALATGMYGASYAYLSVLNQAMYFQAGVLAYSLVGRSELGGMQKLSGWAVAVSVGLMVFNAQTFLFNFLILFALACGLWVACAHAGLPAMLDNVATRYLGRISYGLYLVHPFVLMLLSKTGVFGHGPLTIVPGICAVLLVATLCHRYFESPAIALGERLLAASGNPKKMTGYGT